MIYLDGNSLGAQPKASLTRAQVRHHAGMGHRSDYELEQSRLVWSMPSAWQFICLTLIGAEQDEVVVTDSTSINLFKAIAAALQIQANNPVNNGTSCHHH